MTEAQTTPSISRLILFNATKNRLTAVRQVLEMTHAETRNRTLVDKLYNLGLSISYDRVLRLSTDMGNSISTSHFRCPRRRARGTEH